MELFLQNCHFAGGAVEAKGEAVAIVFEIKRALSASTLEALGDFAEDAVLRAHHLAFATGRFVLHRLSFGRIEHRDFTARLRLQCIRQAPSHPIERRDTQMGQFAFIPYRIKRKAENRAMLFELTSIDLALPSAIQHLFKARKAHFGLTSVFAQGREGHVKHSILFGRAVIQRDRQEALARVQFHLRLEGHAIVSIQYGSYGQAPYLLANYLVT